MTKGISRSLLAFLALLLIATGGAWVFRLPLASQAAIAYLGKKGLSSELRVTALDFSHLEVAEIRLGESLLAKRLALDFELQGLAPPRPRDLTIAGLELRLDLDDPRGPLGALGGLLPASEGTAAGAGPRHLPQIILSDAKITLITPLAPVTLALDGEIWPDVGAALAGAFEISAEAQGIGRLEGSLSAVRDAAGNILADLEIGAGAAGYRDLKFEGISGHLTLESDGTTPVLVEAGLLAEEVRANLPLPDGGAFRDLRFQALFDGGRLGFDLELTEAAGEGRVTLIGEFDDLLRGGLARGQATVFLDASSPLPLALGLPDIESGELRLNLGFEGRAPALALAAVESAMAEEVLVLSGSLSAESLKIADIVERLDLAVSLEGEASAAGISGQLLDATELSLAGLSEALLTRLGLPEELRRRLAKGVSLTLAATRFNLPLKADGSAVALETQVAAASSDGDLSLVGTVDLAVPEGPESLQAEITGLEIDLSSWPLPAGHLTDIKLTGRASFKDQRLAAPLRLEGALAALDVGPFHLEGGRFSLPFDLLQEPSRLELNVGADNRIVLERLQGPAGLENRAPLAFSLSDAAARFFLGESTGLELQADILSDSPAFALKREETELGLSLDSLALSLNAKGTLGAETVLVGRFEVPRAAVTDLSAGKLLGELGETSGDFSIALPEATASLRLASDSLFAPQIDGLIEPPGITLKLQRNAEGRLDFEGELVGDPVLPVTFIGAHDPGSDSGGLAAVVTPIAFMPEGLQPSDYLLPSGGLKRVLGPLSAAARLSWLSGQLESSGTLDLGPLAFEVEGIAVEGLTARINLDQLWPINGAGQQEIALRQIDPGGLPVSDLEILFTLAPGNGIFPVITVEEGHMRLLESNIRIMPVEIDMNEEKKDLVIAVEALDLARLFDLAGFEEVAGSGEIAGQIPLSVTPDGVVIRNGSLAAVRPGKLSIRSERARALLAGGGEQVALLLEALEDFHYQVLELTLDKTAAEDLTARLSLLGSNPEVREGRPFQLNINLDSNVEQILDALVEGYRISNEAFLKVWRLAQ